MAVQVVLEEIQGRDRRQPSAEGRENAVDAAPERLFEPWTVAPRAGAA
jgi:hypothetical protein